MSKCCRNFNQQQINTLVEQSIMAQTNLYKYVCVENFSAIYCIARSIGAIVEHNIIPEIFWHGDENEFTWLLILMCDKGYAKKGELLEFAKQDTNGGVRKIADYFYQHMNIMFEPHQTYKGYIVLEPTEFMKTIYPYAQDKLYVFTHNQWRDNNSYTDEISCRPVIVMQAGDIDKLPEKIKKLCGVTV